MQSLSPVKAAEREIFMDVLRGFAILGIFIANLGSGFSWYRESAHLTGPMLLPELDHKMSFLHQIIISTIWLKYFNYGPLEWLWRSATYKKWQPLKKTQTVSA